MLVSVVIPTYNRRSQVPLAIESALGQPETLEVVVVDDGSSDDTAGVLRARFGEQIRLIATPHRGVSAARNCGVAHARGEWLALIDSDDLWMPGKMRAQLA